MCHIQNTDFYFFLTANWASRLQLQASCWCATTPWWAAALCGFQLSPNPVRSEEGTFSSPTENLHFASLFYLWCENRQIAAVPSRAGAALSVASPFIIFHHPHPPKKHLIQDLSKCFCQTEKVIGANGWQNTKNNFKHCSRLKVGQVNCWDFRLPTWAMQLRYEVSEKYVIFMFVLWWGIKLRLVTSPLRLGCGWYIYKE